MARKKLAELTSSKRAAIQTIDFRSRRMAARIAGQHNTPDNDKAAFARMLVDDARKLADQSIRRHLVPAS